MGEAAVLGGVMLYAAAGLVVVVADGVLSRRWHGGVEARFRRGVPSWKVLLGVFGLWPLFVSYWARMLRRGYHGMLEGPGGAS